MIPLLPHTYLQATGPSTGLACHAYFVRVARRIAPYLAARQTSSIRTCLRCSCCPLDQLPQSWICRLFPTNWWFDSAAQLGIPLLLLRLLALLRAPHKTGSHPESSRRSAILCCWLILDLTCTDTGLLHSHPRLLSARQRAKVSPARAVPQRMPCRSHPIIHLDRVSC